MSRAYRVVLPSFIFASLGILGCRTEDDGTGGAGGSSSATMSTGTKGTTTTTGNMSTTGSNTMSSTGTGQVGCNGDEHTVQDISDGTIGPGIKITVKGAVAMSEKFLVAGTGKNPTSCLWGVFISAPGLTETGPNTGVIALSYGNEPSIPAGSTDGIAYCPKQEPGLPGDKFPDDTKPGDVLDLVGVTAVFPKDFTNCDTAKGDPAQTVPMRQLTQVCSVTKTGTATPPAPHKLTADEISKLASTTDTAFHDQWGGVQVQLDNAVVEPQMGASVGTDFKLHVQSGIEISNKPTFRAYKQDTCHGGFHYPAPPLTLTKVVGFHYLNFCDWEIAVGDKCGGMVPPSNECVMDNITSCIGQ